MVGNDIVDLLDRDSDPSSLSSRFDARVFREAERDAIASADRPSRERWRLWAAKEASFKLARQLARPLGHDVVFSPVRFRVELVRNTGFVRHDDHVFRVEVREGDDWLHAIALPIGRSIEEVIVREQDIADAHPHHQSEAVRSLALEAVALGFHHPVSDLAIRKADGIPRVWLGDRLLSLSLSLSHHGRLIALTCCEIHPPSPQLQIRSHPVAAGLSEFSAASRGDGART